MHCDMAVSAVQIGLPRDERTHACSALTAPPASFHAIPLGADQIRRSSETNTQSI
jgi:hypothetical protein